MTLKQFNREVEKMSQVNYHRAFVNPDDFSDPDFLEEKVERADIYFRHKISMGQAVEEMEKLELQGICYAQMVNEHKQKVSFSICGNQRSVDYRGQSYQNLDELAVKLDMPFHWTEVTDIHLCF